MAFCPESGMGKRQLGQLGLVWGAAGAKGVNGGTSRGPGLVLKSMSLWNRFRESRKFDMASQGIWYTAIKKAMQWVWCDSSQGAIHPTDN